MIKLGIIAIVMGIILLIVMALFPAKIIDMFIVTWIGALVGTWVSYGARKFEINIEQLSVIEKDMMEPSIRLIYIGICSIIFELFLIAGIGEIEIGNINTANIQNDIRIQFLFGIICGLVESKSGINVYKKAISLVGDVA